jgi:outer membrane protein OmpA-like peptidoglycan-associated protein
MKQSMKHVSVPTVVLTVLFTFSGCARKTYVKQQVDALQPAIKEASNSSKETAERIDAVDKRTQQAITAAQTADQKAAQAGTTAQAAQQTAQGADRKGDEANQGVQQANNRISTLENRIANLGDNYAESGKTTIMFSGNSSTLSKEAQATLDKFAETTTGLKSGYMVEIRGFTDSTGPESYNISLSNSRADSVQRYLMGKGVPLYRISVLGLGKEDPAADNKTKKGRDQNRRVEVTLLKKA